MNQTTLELDIREQLAMYLVGETTLRQFRDWFIDATEQVDLRVAGPLRDLIGEIELRIAEFTSEHASEEEMRTLLLPLIERYVVDLTSAETASSADVSASHVTYRTIAADTRAAAASG